jgi:DNA polymerase-1
MKLKGVDIETTGLSFNRDKIILTGVGQGYKTQGDTFAIPEAIVGHNFKFDAKFLTRDLPHGQRDDRWFKSYAFDTMLAASCLIDRPEKLSLDSCAKHYLNIDTWKSLDRKKMTSYPIAEIAEYCLKDVAVTEQLADKLRIRLVEQGSLKFFEENLMPAARMLAQVEYRGMLIDVPATEQKLANLIAELNSITDLLNSMAGKEVNWRSYQQVLAVLKSQNINPTCYDFVKRTIVESTRDEALQPHKAHPIVEKILKHRELSKLGGYLKGWLEEQYEGRIHTTYNMANTRTGRLSSSGPNLQQVPRDKSIRGLFIPSDGKVFVIADYPQIEPRFAAHYSQDQALLDVFKNREDFYGSIAVRVLGVKCLPNEVKLHHPQMRQVAKVIGLSILYGIGTKKLSDFIKLQTGQIFSQAQCKSIIDDYFRAYPGLLELRKYVEKKVNHNGILTNHYGRKMQISPLDVFAQGVNSLIQSSASDACLFSQLKFVDHPHAKLVAIVHDEVVYEVTPEHADAFGKELCAHMSNIGISCPIEMEYSVGKSWGDKK